MTPKFSLVSLAAAAIFTGFAATPPAFEPGGVSLDFSRSTPPKQQKAQGENLVVNGNFSAPGTDLAGEGRWKSTRAGQFWDGCVYVHMARSDGDFTKELAALRAAGIRKVENGAATLRTPAALARDWKRKIRISNRLRQEIPVERSDRPTYYQLSFKMRGKSGATIGWNHPSVFLYAGKNPPRTHWGTSVKGGDFEKKLPFTADWSEQRFNYTAPPGTACVKVDFALYGTGELQIDDVSLVKREPSDAIGVRLIPFYYFDRLYTIGENLPGNLLFSFGSETPPDRKNLRLILELPAGFSVVAQRDEHPLVSSRKLDSGATEYVFDLSRLSAAAFLKDFRHWQGAAILIESSLPAAAEKRPAFYRVENDRFKGEKQRFDLQVVPAVKGKKPQHFITSGMFSTDFHFSAPGISRAGELYANSGFNSAHGGSGLWAKELQKRGITRYRQIYNIRNGFHVLPPPLDPEVEFEKIDGSKWQGATCPAVVYTRHPAYRKAMIPFFEKELGADGASDHIMCNWEPFMFDFRGCFCSRCKEEFKRHSALPPAEVDALWPGQIAVKYKDQWIRFRSWQHGRLVSVLEEDIHAAGKKAGKNSHFIPEISFHCATANGRAPYAQYDILDYVENTPVLNPWGPYIYHATGRPYIHYPAPHLASWTAAEEVRKFLHANTKKMPELVALPHGTLDDPDWFSEPESIAFEFLCYFVHGYRGAFGYYFPRGGDYRYWKALAGANSLIAENETVWSKGREITRRIEIEPVSPFPEKSYFPDSYSEEGDVPPVLPGLHKKKLFQFRAFALDGKTVAAVGNFWKHGELFFRFKLSGLNPEERYKVSVPGAVRGVYSGAELAKGILLQAGALRWQFVTVEPDDRKSTPALSDAAFDALLQKRLPSIRAAYEMEKREYEKHRKTLADSADSNDFSQLKPIVSNRVEMRASGKFLNISTPKYTLEIDPGTGGRIVRFRSGKTVLFGVPGKLGFGIDGFFYPVAAAKQLTDAYRFEGAEATPGGIAVRLTHDISPRRIPSLAGMRITKSYTFTPDGVEVESMLRNHSENGMNFAFRFHYMPEFLGVNENRSGEVAFQDKTCFRREYFEKLYRYAPADAELEKAFKMHRIFNISRPEATFSAPWSPVKLRTEIDPAELQCIVFWDDGKDPSATFEPVFRRRALAPGREVRYKMKWNIEK